MPHAPTTDPGLPAEGGGAGHSMEDLFASETMWEQGALICMADADLDRAVAMPGVVPQMSVTPGGVHQVGPERGVKLEAIERSWSARV